MTSAVNWGYRITQERFMPSPNQDLPKNQTPESPKLPVASDILLSLVALPMLGGLLAAKAAADFVGSIGVESEEVFRGARLPVLNFPRSHDESAQES
ncbi:hypothetical protein QUB68_26420 [Microcoleus sp. A006_D1]|uniref:hypothetical protein n=1 Tax=Microcoleus sp. A006_D1 TaxID=3055267 RepID=UPI002FD16369